MQTFEAIIIEAPRGGAYIEIPFDFEEFYQQKRIKVKAIFDMVEYRGSLVKMKTDCHILGIPKAIREKLNKQIGDTVFVQVEKDEEVRVIELPSNFESMLHQNKDTLSFWKKLSYSNQKKYVNWITSAKKEETKLKRLTLAIEKLINQEKI